MQPPTDVGTPGGSTVGRTERPCDAGARPGRALTSVADEDGALIARVRDGDTDAFGVLYERHAATARKLAGRLCRDRHEADDVVSEVFANTLRALRRGNGPTDDLQPYVLRAVRHTVVNLRTRKDTGRATPTPRDELDRAMVDEPVRFADAVGHAFVELPERFQDVLWMTCIEGRTPVEVGRRSDLEPSAVTSLAHRARRALGRSYLAVATRRPGVPAGCAPIRELLPTYVQGNAAAATARRVHQHLHGCEDCTAVSLEMTRLNRSLASVSSFALVGALLRNWRRGATGTTVGIGTGTVAPLAMIAVVTSMLVTGGAGPAGGAGPDGAPDATTAAAAPAAETGRDDRSTAGRDDDSRSDPEVAGERSWSTADRAGSFAAGAGEPAGATAGDPSATDPPGPDRSALDVSELDLSALDLSGLDPSGIDLSALDLSAIDPAVLDAVLATLELDDVDLGDLDLSALDLTALDLGGLDLTALDPALLTAVAERLGEAAATPAAGAAAAVTTSVPATVPTTLPAVPTTLPAVPTTLPAVPTPAPAVPTPAPAVPTTLPAVPTTLPAVPTTLPAVPTTLPLGGLDTGL